MFLKKNVFFFFFFTGFQPIIESVWECRRETLNGRVLSAFPHFHSSNTSHRRYPPTFQHRLFFFSSKKYLISQHECFCSFYKQNFRIQTYSQSVFATASKQSPTAPAAYQRCHHLAQFRRVNWAPTPTFIGLRVTGGGRTNREAEVKERLNFHLLVVHLFFFLKRLEMQLSRSCFETLHFVQTSQRN